MNNEQTDKLVNDFLAATDAANKLEEDINLFAEEVAPFLCKTGNALRQFRDAVYTFNMNKQTVKGILTYTIKVVNLTAYRNTIGTMFQNSVHVMRGTFEFDPDYDEVEQVKQTICLIFFRIFDLVAKPEVEDDGKKL